MAIFYDITPLGITEDVDTDYVAKVKTQGRPPRRTRPKPSSMADRIFEGDLLSVFSHMEGAIRDLVSSGRTVTTDDVVYQPTIKGAFTKAGGWDSGVNSLVCSVNASQTFKSAMGAAQISTITDASTGSSSGTIIPGGIITVKGQKIKCVDASGSYVLRITTYFTKGALLKTARWITSDTLTVATSE